MKKCLLTLVAATAVLCTVQAQSITYYAADAAPALRVYNGDADENLVITIYSGGAAATNTVVIGSTSTTIDGSGDDDTVAELAVLIAACTNSGGTKALTVDTDCVAATTESTDGELLDGSYTATPGTWVDIPWDTSDVKHYSVYIPDANAGGEGRVRGTMLDSIYGDPTGTGTVTLSIYIDGTLAWQNLMYEQFEYSNNTATVALPIDVGIPIDTKSVLVRATRATTATTGILGVVTE